MLQRFQVLVTGPPKHRATLAEPARTAARNSPAPRRTTSSLRRPSPTPRSEERVPSLPRTDVPTRPAGVTRLSQDEASSPKDSRVTEAKRTLTGPRRTRQLAAKSDSYDGLDGSTKWRSGQVRAATTALAETLKSLATQAQTAIGAAEVAIVAAQTGWTNAVRERRDEHAEVLRKLVEDGPNGTST